MTTALFLVNKGKFSGYKISGHSTSGADDDIGRIVCASVSSAVYMAANTLTEIVGIKADITVTDADMSLELLTDSESAQIILKGLKLHLEQLAEQYKEYLKTNTEAV